LGQLTQNHLFSHWTFSLAAARAQEMLQHGHVRGKLLLMVA
jgi:hypothetical protein